MITINKKSTSAASDHVRGATRRYEDRQRLRGLLLEGASSSPTPAVDDAYFVSLRQRAIGRKG
jgi:antitoxin ParD1/3/4